LMVLTLCGFAVHYFLPIRIRLPIFLLLNRPGSPAGAIFNALRPAAACWPHAGCFAQGVDRGTLVRGHLADSWLDVHVSNDGLFI
jgi:hypothetical protein